MKTVHRAFQKAKLKFYYAKRKPYLNVIQKCHHLLWTNAHLKWSVAKWESVLWSDELTSDIFGNYGCGVLRLKRRGCYIVISTKFKSLMKFDGMEEH